MSSLFFRRSCGLFLFAVSIGFGWAYCSAQKKLSWQFPVADNQTIVEIAGTVTGISQLQDKRLRFDLQLATYRGVPLAKRQAAKIRLYWSDPVYYLVDGDVITAQVKLKQPWHTANPGSFDQEKQFFIEGIRASGKVIAVHAYQAGSHSITRLRQALNDELGRVLHAKALLGVIQATTLGVYANITPEQWQVFQITGTSHAIAISGLHVGLVAMLCGYLVTFVTRRFRVCTQRLPASHFGAIAGMLGALAYSAIAGFSIPTQRSLVMVMVGMLAVLKGQRLLSWDCLGLAWLVIGLIDPLATLQVGFWLSFGCIAALVYASSHARGNQWRQWLLPQWSVFIGLMPIGVVFFQQLTPYAPLANFLTLPIISFIVVPLSLLGVLCLKIWTPMATLSLTIAHGALEIAWLILAKIAQFPFSLWQQGVTSILRIVLALLGIVLLLAPRGLPLREIGWLYLLPMFFYPATRILPGECRFTLLDVGQGLAAVIQTQHHTLVYDTGPRYGAHSDAGQRVIIPFLITQNIQRIDTLVISHHDLDHAGGVESLRRWPIGEIFSSEPHKIPDSRQCIAGQHWEWDGVRFTMLSPRFLSPRKRNNLSCVLKIQTQRQSILLTGDIEEPVEAELLQAYFDDLPSTILVVPHHGSMTSSSKAFVERVAPQYALYPVGFANQYGFPRAAVVERYQKIGSENIWLYQTGAISFHLNGQDELTPPTYWRDTSYHYWHLPRIAGEKGG